jgi:hypothetical protein
MDMFPKDGYDYVQDDLERIDPDMVDDGLEDLAIHIEAAALQSESSPARVGRFATSAYVAVAHGARYLPIMFM